MIQLPWLDDISLAFPAPQTALTDPDGLLAAGGDLSPDRLIEAYRQGIFPWYSDGQPILWWSPDPRAVLFPGDVHVSRSMRKVLRQRRFEWTLDRDFEAVIDACAAPRDGEPGTWITDEMFDAYCQLHRLGVAHSVEVWQAGELVGGLYGLALGRVFFGESMFSTATNASKVAFIQLARQLDEWGFTLLDGQVGSAHLFSLGAREIPRSEFMRHLASIRPGERDSVWGRQVPANHLE